MKARFLFIVCVGVAIAPLIICTESLELKEYQPVACPENVTFSDQVCSCHGKDKIMDLSRENTLRKECIERITKMSSQTYEWLMESATKTWDWVEDCKRPEQAFRQSILLSDKTEDKLLLKFAQKMNQCEGRTVSIVVFGGSVTAGQVCPNSNGREAPRDPEATDFLGLPENLTLPVVRGKK
jgi:hypothetical protein